MTTIKATCPTCGEVSLSPGEIELRVDDTDDSRSFYGFTCPACLSEVRKPADHRVVRLLVSGGVALLHLPPRARFTAPPLTHDDLLDFHQLLETDHWFVRLLDVARARQSGEGPRPSVR